MAMKDFSNMTDAEFENYVRARRSIINKSAPLSEQVSKERARRQRMKAKEKESVAKSISPGSRAILTGRATSAKQFAQQLTGSGDKEAVNFAGWINRVVKEKGQDFPAASIPQIYQDYLNKTRVSDAGVKRFAARMSSLFPGAKFKVKGRDIIADIGAALGGDPAKIVAARKLKEEKGR